MESQDSFAAVAYLRLRKLLLREKKPSAKGVSGEEPASFPVIICVVRFHSESQCRVVQHKVKNLK